jgi:hypothetical protein
VTDRLTPGQLRDLANIFFASGRCATGTPIREEAARREAEAKQGPLTGIEAGPDAVHPKPPVEGPGSADARKCRACGASDGDMCGMFGQTPRPDDCLASYKPAPAADRIEALQARVAELERYENIFQNAAGKAAVRAEGLEDLYEKSQARVARLTEALREARIMVASWGAYANDYFKGKHDLAGDLAEIDAALAEAPDAE